MRGRLPHGEPLANPGRALVLRCTEGAGVMRAGGGQQGRTGSGVHKSSMLLTGWGLVLFVAAAGLRRTAMCRRVEDPGHNAGSAAGVMMAWAVLSPPPGTRCWPGEADRANGDGARTWQAKPSTELTSGSCCGAARATVGLRRRSLHAFTRREDVLRRTGSGRQRGRAEQLVPRDPAERNHLTTISACPRSTAEPVATSSEQEIQLAAQLGGGRWRLSCPHAGAGVANTSEVP
jgi:hypothetical protein